MIGYLIMQSLEPFEGDPEIYSIGGFAATSKDGREFRFDWEEGESWVEKDEQGKLFIETRFKNLDNIFDEENIKNGIKPEELTPEFITSSKLTEVFYECFPTEEDELTGTYIQMEPFSFRLVFYDPATHKDTEAEFPIEELKRYQKEDALWKPYRVLCH